MTIKLLAEFMDWHLAHWWCGDDKREPRWVTGGITTIHVDDFDPYTDANDTLLVEARLREKGLWKNYIWELYQSVTHRNTFVNWRIVAPTVMAATLPQRMTAAIQVIQEKGD